MLPCRQKTFLGQVLTDMAAMAQSPEKRIKLLAVYIDKLSRGCAISSSQSSSKRILPWLRVFHTGLKGLAACDKMRKTRLLFRKFRIFSLFSGYFAQITEMAYARGHYTLNLILPQWLRK
jgi:hypothetical protein